MSAHMMFKNIVEIITYLWFTVISGVIDMVNAKTTGKKNAMVRARFLPRNANRANKMPKKNNPDNKVKSRPLLSSAFLQETQNGT